MDRRSFLLGSASVAVVAALPIAKAVTVTSGTVSGRWASSMPSMSQIPKHRVKSIMFAWACDDPEWEIGDDMQIDGEPYTITAREAVSPSAIEVQVARNIEYGRDFTHWRAQYEK